MIGIEEASLGICTQYGACVDGSIMLQDLVYRLKKMTERYNFQIFSNKIKVVVFRVCVYVYINVTFLSVFCFLPFIR